MERIILASGSPRRRELLAQTGLEFEVIPGEVDENAVIQSLNLALEQRKAFSDSKRQKDSAAESLAETISQTTTSGTEQLSDTVKESLCYPAEVVKALSQSKAEAVAAQIPEGIVIGSDTIVWDNEVLGKPADRAEAFRMLRQLAGRIHSVYTGVTVLVKEPANTDTAANHKVNSDLKQPSALSPIAENDSDSWALSAISPESGSDNSIKKHVFFCETKVEVYPMTDREIEAYLDTGEAMDKAGAYGIQGKFGLWVKGIEGDYNSVVGLPLSAVWQVLKEYV
ncbi:MAG: Maf family protein [Lachnospiraceae bacterium]|nr:Maf family protein [Lachnospiraceae bacterium]